MSNDIKVPKNIIMDYIPKDFRLCDRCMYGGICPFEYKCPTLMRVREAEKTVKE